eukprot:CAMPEP_0118896750 /NCGR_PEP_ID=MMETSP1166-20130328/4461_1 /TAXON_ID=1104430 /ORGANISM="Chrysoreinhardia sp, Strain CCMP3193" /LENGTH=395 /DNA_ID=CAMNT_0006835809 /DNA_START=26 /DNA_END=1213 /DNA_ORIENTATION=+
MAEPPEYEEDRTRVDVNLVSVPNAWLLGANRAAEILRAADDGESPLYDADDVDWDQMAAAGVDMFRPFGDYVGLSGVDAGIADDEDQGDPGAGDSVNLADDSVRDLEASLEASCTIERKQRTVLDANNQPVSLEAACRDVRRAKKKTTERTRRAAGVEKAPGRFEKGVELEEMDGVIVAGVDPLLFFFGAAAGGTSIGLGIPESFVSPGAPGLALAEIEQGALADPKSKVVLVVMNPKSDGASADVLVFSPSRTCGKIEVAGPLVRPLDPDLGRDDGELYFKVERRLLDATMFLQWETMTEPHRSQVRMTTLGGLPYMDAATSEPMFICAGTEGKREKRGALGSSKSPKVTCLVCAKEFGAPEMRQHMGFHLIHERETVPEAMPCGFCGGDSAQF